ncbi:hypothetical protein ES703_53648 [subsurface metagenome]
MKPKIILIVLLIIVIAVLWGSILKNPSYVSYGEACLSLSPTQDTENYNCSYLDGVDVCVSPPEKFNETCACVGGMCICD